MRIMLLGMAAAVLSFGALTHIYVDQRQDFEKGKPFGQAGPLERITGWAVFSPDTKVAIEYLKPRMPANANGALVLLTGKAGMPKELMEQGYSLLRADTTDANAIRDLITYLRYGGQVPTFLLADQRRVIKRAIIVGEGPAVERILMTNKTPKNEPLFDGAVITGGADSKIGQSVKTVRAKAQIHAAVAELDPQLSSPSK
jgi:hypothetical protein